tara:strand:+ start:745 stop:1290 length:546 start_codon:yes stop_codon:yes gene_type:complete
MIRIGDGDTTAYKMLVDRHLQPFLAFATRVTGDRSEAEDVMQEAFVRVWKTAGRWDMNRNTRFTTWFYRVVMNLCIDVKRKRKPTSDFDEAFDVQSEGPLPDDMLRDKQKAAHISAALSQLPERQRMAVTLCYLQELGNRQAADILEVSVGAVESLLVRGRTRLAEILAEEKDELLKESVG